MGSFRDGNESRPCSMSRKGLPSKDGGRRVSAAMQRTVCGSERILFEEDVCQNPQLDVCGRIQDADDLDSTQKLESQMMPQEDGAREVQQMDYEDETQVLDDFGVIGETQLLDDHYLGGETQVQDDPYFGGETQPMDDAYHELETRVVDDPHYELETQVLNNPYCDLETQILNDPYYDLETQVLNDQYNVDETQLLDAPDIEDETHAMNDPYIGVDETQVLNDIDDYENLCTQVVVDSEGEETDTTEVLSDTEGFFDYDSAKLIGSQSAHEESRHYSSPLKQDGTGLALAENTVTCTDNSDSLKKPICEVDEMCDRCDSPLIREEHDHEKQSPNYENIKEVGDKNASSTVRKLFHEDLPSENEDPTNSDADHDNELAGLSYVDSQEPGDLSQAHAIEFIDKFLKVNVMETDLHVDHPKVCTNSFNPNSVAKGSLDVAKLASSKTTCGRSVTFDWDDNREDEGGGDFFSRKKEDFFNTKGQGKRSFTVPRNFKGSRLNQLKEKEERPNVIDRTRNGIHSDSKLLLHDSKGKGKPVQVSELTLKKNLLVEFEEQQNVDRLGESSTNLDTNIDRQEVQNVGFDTQLAAEAMEALCQGEPVANQDVNLAYQGNLNTMDSFNLANKRSTRSNSRIVTRQTKKPKNIGVKSRKESSLSSEKDSDSRRKQIGVTEVETKPKRKNSNVTKQVTIKAKEIKTTVRLRSQRQNEAPEKSSTDNDAMSRQHISAKRQSMDENTSTLYPIAKRTRRSTTPNQLNMCDNAINSSTKMNSGSKVSVDREKRSYTDCVFIGGLSYPTRRRTRQSFSCKVNEWGHSLDASSKLVDRRETDGHNITIVKGKSDAQGTSSIDICMKRRTRSSSPSAFPDRLANLEQQITDKSSSVNAIFQSDYANLNGKNPRGDVINGEASDPSDIMPDAIELSPNYRCKQSGSACTTPINCNTPINRPSPVCMGNEYFKQSCINSRSRACLMEQFDRTVSTPPSASKESRKRRDIALVRPLLSQHLDEDTIKQQQKILSRLRASLASSISEATHFVTDNFVRTRNMLEAIALGKPVVTPLWLESCNQTSCFIDEKNYILRDYKKEKEFGFCMPVSLARACQHPLLQNRRVFITPNTNPGKDIIASLVKAVHGQAIERLGRSALKDNKIPGDLLIISCDEDYSVCLPYLEKGASVYSSELLLNGIVTQKLDYERHRLFEDHIKKTRSTVWLKRDGRKFIPV